MVEPPASLKGPGHHLSPQLLPTGAQKSSFPSHWALGKSLQGVPVLHNCMRVSGMAHVPR